MDWPQSPCSDCLSSPCCSYLPLSPLSVETRTDLAGTEALLGHRHFRVGLRETGAWMLFYHRTCRFLDERSSKCRIFGAPERPLTCLEYSPNPCWYKRSFAGAGISDLFLLFGLRRFKRFGALLAYDSSGEIATVPSWEDLAAALEPIPLEEEPEAAPVSRLFGFKTGVPSEAKHFELFRFRLGFPGVRIGISASGWYTIAESSGPEFLASPLPHLFPEDDPAIEVGGLELWERACRDFQSRSKSAKSKAPPEMQGERS